MIINEGFLAFLKYNALTPFYPFLILGMRYALRALKLAIIHTVRTFQIVAAPGTPEVDKLFFSNQKNGFTPSIKFRVEKIK